MTNKEKQRKKSRKGGVLPAFLLAFLLVFAILGVTLAKYVQRTERVDAVTGSEFYFTSPQLTEEGATYTLSADTTQLSITLCNYADELRISDVDIAYSVEVDNGAIISPDSGTIQTGDKTATVTLSNLQPGQTYTVTATATSPFSAKLTGNFTVASENSALHYSVADKADSPYALLTVWTDNYAGNVTVSWQAGLIPDSTDAKFDGVSTYSGGTYSAGSVKTVVDAYSSYTYRFFKSDTTKNYTNLITAEKEGAQ